jgi:hypothetical protein
VSDLNTQLQQQIVTSPVGQCLLPAQSQFMEVALHCLDKGWYVFPLGERSKIPDGALAPNGFNSSSNDPNQIREWWTISPNANIGINLGRSNLTVLDFDNGKPPVELGLPTTLQVNTSRGTHVYLQGVSKQGDMHLNDVHVGEIKSVGGYVLSPFSVHPTGAVYSVALKAAIAPIPEGLIDRLRPERKPSPTIKGEKIPRGSHDKELTRIAGRLRHDGLEEKAMADALIEVCENRCENYGSDYREMCKKIAKSVCRYQVGANTDLVLSIVPVGMPTENHQPVDWRGYFKSVGELEQGEVRMLIDGVLPEGTTFIGGLPGEGKTLFALSVAKALTTGEPFLGNFEVPEIVAVIYLIPESSGRAFRKRCEKFHIPNDPELFLCRTVSEGATLPLDDASLFEAVRRLRPVVILDTLIRFSKADDENAAMQNKKLVDDIIRLRQAGATGVIGLHHAAKIMREKGMSLESALRGTGDIAACADAVYGLIRDSALYSNGAGPNEIDVACLKPRDFEPPMPFRIAASQKVDSKSMTLGPAPGIISLIDSRGDFLMVSKAAGEQTAGETLERLVKEDPVITLEELSKITGQSTWAIRQTLKKRNWVKSRGGTRGASRWTVSPASGLDGTSPAPLVNLNTEGG